MTAAEIIKLAVSTVVFSLCLAGYIHTKSVIRTEGVTKKLKHRKIRFFAGMLMGGWFVIGVLITAISGVKGQMNISFTMFSERVNVFGLSLEKTTIISSGIILALIVLCILFRVFAFPRFKEKPGKFQNIVELCVDSMYKMTLNVLHSEKYAKELSPYMLAVAFYLVACATVELFGLRAPTSDLTVTFSLALITFILLNVYGLRNRGLKGRILSMSGPIKPMRVLMLPLKIVSDVAVPVSLSCRLFGNMLGGMIVMELLKGSLGGYATGVPAIAGLYFNLFHPLIQAYIFIILSLTFIDEAME